MGITDHHFTKHWISRMGQRCHWAMKRWTEKQGAKLLQNDGLTQVPEWVSCKETGCLWAPPNPSHAYLLWWNDFSFGCSKTNSTTNSRIRATELAVEATMDSVGTPIVGGESFSTKPKGIQGKMSNCHREGKTFTLLLRTYSSVCV